MSLAMTTDDVLREIVRVRDVLSEFEALLPEEPITALAWISHATDGLCKVYAVCDAGRAEAK